MTSPGNVKTTFRFTGSVLASKQRQSQQGSRHERRDRVREEGDRVFSWLTKYFMNLVFLKSFIGNK